MKKLICMALALCICAMSAVPVLADTAESDAVAAVILAVKNKLNIDDETFVFDNYNKDEYGNTLRYYLNWVPREKDNYGAYRSIHVNALADGTIRTYSYNTDMDTTRRLPKATKEQATEAATAFLAQVDEGIADEVEFLNVSGPQTYSHTYQVSFVRMANGLPVVSNGVDISLDADTLEVYEYHANWTEGVTFPSPDGAITPDAANQAYRDNLGYELRYEFVQRDEKQTPILVYGKKYPEVAYIDAMTGEATLLPRQVYGASGGGNYKLENAVAADATMGLGAVLSEEEQALVDEVAQMLSQKKAEELARAVPEFKLDDLVVDGYRVYKNEDAYTVRISFIAKEKEPYAYKSVTIDAKSGEILSFSGSVERSVEMDKQASLTRADGLKIAEAFVDKYYSEKKSQTSPANTLNTEGTSYEWERMVNGIRTQGNGLGVTVDEKTGDIVRFSNQWYAGEFPDPSDAANIEDVYDKVLAEDNYYLAYVLQAQYDEAVPYRYGNETYQAYAVYTAQEQPRYDGVTANELDYNGNPVAEKADAYTDTDGHYVVPYAEALKELGIGYPGEILRPDTATYQDEYMRLISQAVYGREFSATDQDNMYSYLVGRKVISKDEISPDKFVTRMDAIRYLLKAMGMSDAAEIPGIYQNIFADVDEQNAGYAAIAGGLKLVDTSADTFRPHEGITRAETLVILHRYLAR